MAFLIPFLVKLISTELTKTVIAYGINKLLESKDDGITKDLAITLIDGVAKSKLNPTTEDMFKDAIVLLK
jgi:hypothetical protein